MTSSSRPIALIGFRASGKSTLATILAARLKRPLISSDKLIEERIGTSISEFVLENGWAAFRDIESEVIAGLPLAAAPIIDFGGGVIERPGNMVPLLGKALIIWVDATLADIADRLQSAGDRPLLSHDNVIDDIRENYQRRQPLYQRYSDLRIDTSTTSVEKACQTIIENLKL